MRSPFQEKRGGKHGLADKHGKLSMTTASVRTDKAARR
jgi:hypothetical protein